MKSDCNDQSMLDLNHQLIQVYQIVVYSHANRQMPDQIHPNALHKYIIYFSNSQDFLRSARVQSVTAYSRALHEVLLKVRYL